MFDEYYEDDFETSADDSYGITCYSLRPIKTLFEQYVFENDRVNQEDAKRTKLAITKEMYRRLKLALEQLETAENDDEALRIYRNFVDF